MLNRFSSVECIGRTIRVYDMPPFFGLLYYTTSSGVIIGVLEGLDLTHSKYEANTCISLSNTS